MRLRNFAPLAIILVVSCGTASDETATAEPTQDYAADTSDVDAMAAIGAVADFWETHYNMGHGSMVADKYADGALSWSASGDMLYGKEAIGTALQTGIDATGAQIDLQQDEVLVFGDVGISRGTYSMTGTADGQAFASSGNYMSLAQNVDGEWLLQGTVSNSNTADPLPFPGTVMEAPAGVGAELIQDRADFYKTHFNMSHASMVADTYTEDAVLMNSGEMIGNGRAAALTRLQGMVDAGVQINEINTWSASELDENHVTGVGTFSLTGPEGDVAGHFAALYKRGEDGELMLHWLLTSDHPSAM